MQNGYIPRSMTERFSALQNRQREYLETRGWLGQTPKSVSMSIAIEAAELMEEFQWDGDSSADRIRESDEHMDRIREEVADVLIYCMNLEIELDIDLLDAVEAKIEANERRDRPVKDV